jgi:hypothetical protein
VVADRQNKDVGDASITANVDFGKTEDGGFGLGVELIGHLPDLSREEAQELMEEAHEVCPYSRATRGNIGVKLTVGDWRTVRGPPRTPDRFLALVRPDTESGWLRLFARLRTRPVDTPYGTFPTRLMLGSVATSPDAERRVYHALDPVCPS